MDNPGTTFDDSVRIFFTQKGTREKIPAQGLESNIRSQIPGSKEDRSNSFIIYDFVGYDFANYCEFINGIDMGVLKKRSRQLSASLL